MKIFQTSSALEFNNSFAQYVQQQKIQLLFQSIGITVSVPNFEGLSHLAEAKHLERVEPDLWTGKETKEIDSAFFLCGQQQRFNCGEEHLVSKCTKAKDQEKIEADRKKF